MRTRRKWLLTIAAGAVLVSALAMVGLLGVFSRDNEPRYQGKSLSEWMEIYRMAPVLSGSRTEPAGTKAERVAAFRAREARVAATRAEAELAVRSIGTNALPCLLAWFRYELPSWRNGLLMLATWRYGEGKKVVFSRSLIIGPTARKAEWAGLGFVILNTNAAPAIPELEAMMKENQKPDRGLRAIYALGAIGVPAFRVLTNALADTNQTHRCEIMSAFHVVREISSPSRDAYLGACLPALNRALDDADAEVRRQAKVSLYNIQHWDEILAQAKDGRAFREYMLRARTNAPKTDLDIHTNVPAP
jgi:hypothetical protein